MTRRRTSDARPRSARVGRRGEREHARAAGAGAAVASPALTKLTPPRLPAVLVGLEPAADCVGRILSRPLTVVRAPSGFGKTTFCARLHARFEERGTAVAWVAFDASDDDSAIAVPYIAHALERCLPGIAAQAQALFEQGTVVPFQSIATLVINAALASRSELVLFLDDFDRLEDPLTLQFVSYILLHCPPNLHLVCACQTRPKLPLTWLRAHDGLTEVEADDLRLRREDARRLLGGKSGGLTGEEIDRLTDAMGGWVTGLKIGSAALRNNRDAVAEIGLVAQGAQWLSDYLDENIFAHLPERARAFLLRASVVTPLNAELCAALTGCADAAALLASFAEQNLLLQPLDDAWYRLHPIFQEFLARQLREQHADELPALHRTASLWFAEHGRPREAFRHALESGELEQAAIWAEQSAMRMVEQSDITTLLGWIDRLPPAAVKRRPAVRIAEAWALTLSFRPRVQAVLDELGAAVAAMPAGARRATAALELLGVRAIHAGVYKDDADETRRLASEFLAERPREDSFATRAVRNATAWSHIQAGEFDRARAVVRPAQLIELRREQLFTMSYRQCLLGLAHELRGELTDAERTYQAAMDRCEQRIGRDSASASLAASFLASVLYERDALAEAGEALANRLSVIDETCFHDAVIAAYRVAIRLRVLEGDADGARELLDRAELIAHERRWRRLLAVCAALRARFGFEPILDDGAGFAEIDAGAIDDRPLESATRLFLLGAEARALALLAQGAHDACDGVLARARRLARRVGNVGLALKYDLLRAELCLRVGDSVPAAEQLVAVLVEASSLGFKRSVADHCSEALVANLAKHRAAAVLPGPARRLLAFVQAQSTGKVRSDLRRPTGSAGPTRTVFSVLTSREIEILTGVAATHSNKEIASRLRLMPETVKWHMKNIMKKLNAENRAQAVQHAIELGLTVE
ncbi:MAG TPA: LuxR C-terminal-related transcriptional regulator [Myxococcota bacterium]|nr:LuxR C-terminal-related transcriptional regulator [Myxococcota bacterium]